MSEDSPVVSESKDDHAPPRRRPTGKRAERKRKAIVAAASRIFVEHGYGAGVRLIADTAGVSKVTLYKHFGSKEQLFVEVISEAFDQALGGVSDLALPCLMGTDDLRERLLAVARGWVAGITSPEVTNLLVLVISVTRQFPELGQKWLDRSPQNLARAVADALRDLSALGHLDVPSPELAATQFYALTVCPHVVRSMFGIPFDPHVTEDLVTQGVDMFLSYYTPD